jgi:hypothetical protein
MPLLPLAPDDPETSPGRTAEGPCALPVKEEEKKKERKERKEKKRGQQRESSGQGPPHRP